MKLKKQLFLLLGTMLIIALVLISGCRNSNQNQFTYYTVTFNSNGGSDVESQEVLAGNPVVKPSTPTFEGFTFQGWYTTANANLDDWWDFETDRVNSDMTLYANWTPDENIEPTTSLTFEREGNEYVVTGVNDEASIIVPAVYNGLPVVAIDDAAFARKDITQIVLPDSIREIRLNAFHNCSELTTVYIGENSNLTTIENNAFSGNSSLRSIYFPAGMVNLGDSVFNNCGGIDMFVVNLNNPKFEALNGHLVNKETNSLIRGANNSDVPAGIIQIETAAFRRSTLGEINLPSTVTTINNYAFDNCENLTAINVSSDNETFSSQDGILYNKAKTELLASPLALSGEITLPEQLLAIPQFAFDRRSNLTKINISNTLTSIGNFAFRNVTATVEYDGTEEQWNAITKGSVWGGENLTIVFPTIEEGTKTLVVYFSRTGNTKGVAEQIALLTQGDIVEIVPATPYVENYNELLIVARNELTSNARPAISEDTLKQINIADYNTVFIGYPIWHGSEPMIIRTFIDQYQKLSNKTVYTFSTSASSGGTTAHNNIRTQCSNANVAGNLHLTERTIGDVQNRTRTWLEENGMIVENKETRVKMTFNNKEVFINLVESPATNDLIERLQNGNITLEFSDYASAEKIAYPEPRLDVTGMEGCDPIVGDVTIYVPWGNIAIFYVDSAGLSSSLVKIGTIEGDGISLLRSESGAFTVTLSLA